MKLTKLDRERMADRDLIVDHYLSAGYLEADAYLMAAMEFRESQHNVVYNKHLPRGIYL